MVSSGRKIVPLLLLLSAIVSANAQPAADKTPRATIGGKVTIGGKGVSGVVVGLAIATPSSSIQVTRFRGVTDEDGNYRIRNLPPDTYRVLVAAPAFVQSEILKTIAVGKNEVVENVDITLSRGGVITGRVTDADGRPVVEEQIFFSSTDSKLPYFRTIRTDDRGVYRAFGLPPGHYTVSAGKDSVTSFGRTGDGPQQTYYPSALNASDATAIEISEGSEVDNIDITLGRQVSKYTARGRIIDGDTSQPLPNARIEIQFFFSVSGSTSRAAAAESTKDGEFKIENLPPGKYSVYLDSETDSDRVSEAVRFEVIDQDIDGLLIKTSRGGSISGVVVLEGTREPTIKPNLAGQRIVGLLSGQNNQRIIPAATIDQNGSFRLTGLPAGHLLLNLPLNRDQLRLIRIERDGIVYRDGIDIKEREQITGLRVVVSQANGTIRGVLKLPEGVVLPAPARLVVNVRRVEDPAAFNSPVAADARGQFLVENLVAGTYEFNVAVVGVPGDQRLTIPRPAQTVVVTNGAIADVTITVQLPKTVPGGP
jgi:protocatechuate 3,4-dioxygenase beta subunit